MEASAVWKTNKKKNNPEQRRLKNTAGSLCKRKPGARHWEADPPEGAAQRWTRWPPPRVEPPATTAALRSAQHHKHKCNRSYANIAITVQTRCSNRQCEAHRFVVPEFSHQCSPAPGSSTWSRWWQRFGRKSWQSYTNPGRSVPETKIKHIGAKQTSGRLNNNTQSSFCKTIPARSVWGSAAWQTRTHLQSADERSSVYDLAGFMILTYMTTVSTDYTLKK